MRRLLRLLICSLALFAGVSWADFGSNPSTGYPIVRGATAQDACNKYATIHFDPANWAAIDRVYPGTVYVPPGWEHSAMCPLFLDSALTEPWDNAGLYDCAESLSHGITCQAENLMVDGVLSVGPWDEPPPTEPEPGSMEDLSRWGRSTFTLLAITGCFFAFAFGYRQGRAGI